MKVLILGGTGAMGVHLRGKMVSRGFDVVVTSRSDRVPEDGIRFVKGDASQDDVLRRIVAVEKPDAIVDFLTYGTIAFMNRRDVLLNGTSHYLFLSSCRVFHGEDVHTERSPRLLDVVEDSKYLRTDEYGLAKARQENLLRESGRSNWSIIRPCITYSAPRFQFGCLESSTFVFRAKKGLPSPIPLEMLNKRTTMMWGGDTAEMIARLVLNPSAYGEDFNVVTSESHTWREVAQIYNELLGFEFVECMSDAYLSICNPWQVKYGRMVDHCFDNAKVLAATGMSQKDLLPLKEGLSREVARIGEINPSIRQNALIDRLCHTKVALNLGMYRTLTEYYGVKYGKLNKLFSAFSQLKRIF